ncbi:MAG: DUF362 domain-containing protein [Thermodesulfobacteriota bacterium]
MKDQLAKDKMWIDSPLGKRRPDSGGSPVGVARLDPEKAYLGIGELLQQVINNSSQEAWEKIKAKIDYTYEGLDLALTPLKEETGFEKEIKARLAKGQKLFFKPNLVGPLSIDPQSHGLATASTMCTEWPFTAALMRWFHDRLGVRYHQMAIGEAATALSAMAGLFSMINPEGKKISTEAVIEGRSENFYGGWGFYFVRKYLSELAGTGEDDDPMQGYEASVSGSYTPPGEISGELRVVDLNRIDDPLKGREVPVPEGINFKTITLHKDIIGGDPNDPLDRKTFPGCILINVPKFKVHIQALFTNIIKNLGIGLYPMQFSTAGDCCWEYSSPHGPIPGMKSGIPHAVWVPEMNYETCLPVMDQAGKMNLKKTGGLTATMVDIVKAVQNQDIFMIHIVDGIEATNFDHMGSDMAKREQEGLIFAGLDPVASDLICARYMFSNVPLKEALNIPIDDGAGGRFPQAVPLPVVEGGNIITGEDYDCPLSRDNCFSQAETRGLGKRSYHVLGWDAVSNQPLISLDGHLGRVESGSFRDLNTKHLYFDIFKFPWDLQKTALNYLSSVDQLTGSSLKKTFLEAFDENGDGIISYWETGKKGKDSIFLHQGGYSTSCMATEPLGFVSGRVKTMMKTLKLADPLLNRHGYDFLQEFSLGTVCLTAFRMSQLDLESPDLFVPGMTWGKGKWPSFQTAQFLGTGMQLYGQGFPFQPGFPSLYGSVVFYADLTQTGGKYIGLTTGLQPDSGKLQAYVSGVQKGEEQALDFVFYVPPGYENLGGTPLPNVQATDDPEKVLTVHFKGGEEVWGEI